MRFQSLLFLGVVAANCATSQAAPVRKIVPKGVTNFTSKAQGFAVWLPVKPAQSSGQSPLANTGSLNFRSQQNGVNYVVNVAHFSRDELANPKALLAEMQSGMVDSVGGKVQKVESIRLADFPGREIVLTLGKGTILFRSRIYITPQGTFSIGVGGYKAPMQKQAAQIDKVFDSFRILPQK